MNQLIKRSRTIQRNSIFLVLVSGLLAIPAVEAQDPVAFRDVGLETGFQDRLGHGRALVAADFNGDGRVDFFVGNPGNEDFPDESLILWNDGPNEDGDATFSRGPVLVTADIAFTAAAVDYDNDGDEDLFIGIGGQEGIGLDFFYRNDGPGELEGEWVFTDISEASGTQGARSPLGGPPVPAATSSATWADYDNDGDLDLFSSVRLQPFSLDLPEDLGIRNSLFRNEGADLDGNGVIDFTDVTEEARLGTPQSSMTAAWGDFNNDGWMDLFIPHTKPVGFELYRNNQDGTFTDVDIPEESVNYGKAASWASAVADFNEDGLLDIVGWARVQPGSFDSHALLINQGDLNFVNEAVSSNLTPIGGFIPRTMGTAIGDFDNNGYVDIFTADGGPDSGEVDTLFLNIYNEAEGLKFDNVSQLVHYPAEDDPACSALTHEFKGRREHVVDYENMLPGVPGAEGTIPSRYLSPAGGQDPCVANYPYRGHGSVFVDVDKDGDLDLMAVKGGTAIIAPDLSSTEPNRYFRNDGGNNKNWLYLNVTGIVSNRNGVGARIRVTASRGGEDPIEVYNEPRAGYNFSAGGPREVHFGLGDSTQIDEVRVQWPSGVLTIVEDLAVNQRYDVTETLVFHSDFNGGDAGNWLPVFGNWIVDRNVYGQVGGGPGVAIRDDVNRTDLSVAGKLTYYSGAKRMGLAARTSADGLSYYAATITGSQAQIYKSVGGVPQPLGEAIAVRPMTPGQSYIVRLEAKGDTITMTVNGLTAATVVDTEIESGSVGLVTFNTSASFDNVAAY